MVHQRFEIDQWSAYTYKPAFKNREVGLAPTWVSDDHRRRLEGYMLLTSYLENMSREYLPNDTDPDSRREYGDASLIVQTLVDAILGDDARVMVRGARHNDEPDAYADTLQDYFEQWIEDDRFHMTAIEVEGDAVGLGDGVYVVGWDAKKGRPTVKCYDPGLYFPVLDPRTNHEQFPRKVHIAWEFEEWNERRRAKDKYVRRITYELIEVPGAAYPWDRDSGEVCLMSDGIWSYENLGTKTWLDLDESKAEWQINADGQEVHNLDIGVDFIPIVHLPNTTSHQEHYGRSSLQKILQILDDIQGVDTDLLKTSRTTGSPPLGTESVVPTSEDGKITTYGPGQLIQGKITVVDTSRNLDALVKYSELLLKRLSTNTRMPESVLGKLRPSEVPSGIALALSFGPLRSLVKRLRLSRHEKYPILFKFVHRFAMLQDDELQPALDRIDDVPLIEYVFGTFLPSDRTSIVTEITDLFREKLVARNTAIRLLIQDAGMDIRDAEEEVNAIESENFEGARVLKEAVDSPDTAAEYLGIEIAAVDQSRLDLLKAEAEARPQPFGGGNPNQNGNGQSQRQPQSQET